MKDYCCTLVPRCQVYCRDSTNTLTVQNNVLRTNAIPAEKININLKNIFCIIKAKDRKKVKGVKQIIKNHKTPLPSIEF